jgi:hypothetical protein
LTNQPTNRREQTVWGTLECSRDVVEFEDHASDAEDQLTGTDRSASPTKNYMMSMARLLVLTKYVHHSKNILHKHVISRQQIAREWPAFSVPSVIGWIPHRSVGGQRHENLAEFMVKIL